MNFAKLPSYISLICCCFVSSIVSAEMFEVGQLDKKFTVNKLVIKKGDTVRFINNDPFFHNVFSLSDIKLFDLGSFPKDEYRDVVFDTAGSADVECALHPNMILNIEVTE